MHSGPTPAQDLGRSFPPEAPKGSPPPTPRGSGSHACVPLGLLSPSCRVQRPGEGVVRGVSWLLGSIVGTPSPPVCLVADLENLHRLLGSTVCGPYAYPEPSPGCWGEGWPPWDPPPGPTSTDRGPHAAGGGQCWPRHPAPRGRPEHRHAGSSPEPRGADGGRGSSAWEEASLRPGFCWASSLLNENAFRLPMLVKAWVCVL